jgi:hypothetical protein
MAPARGRRAAFLAGAAGLAVAFLLALQWPRIVLERRCAALEGARTAEEAQPLMGTLLKGARDPFVADLLVGKLDREHPWLTFWVFSFAASAFRLAQSDAGLPLLEALARRLRTDGELMARWSHYLRWHRSWLMRLCLHWLRGEECQGEGPPAEPLGDLMANGLSVELELAGVAWFLDMPLPPGRKAQEGPRLLVSAPALERCLRWLAEKGDSLRFDPEAGRFVLEEGAARQDPAPPGKSTIPLDVEAPLPVWRGPVPQRN